LIVSTELLLRLGSSVSSSVIARAGVSSHHTTLGKYTPEGTPKYRHVGVGVSRSGLGGPLSSVRELGVEEGRWTAGKVTEKLGCECGFIDASRKHGFSRRRGASTAIDCTAKGVD